MAPVTSKTIAANETSLPSSATESSSYTFLVANASRSPSSQHANGVLAVDKHDRFAHTRTKRKRTSPEDYLVLEAVYQRDNKPDKDTRVSLESRVSMTEKEIQVWFQNRRQMSRRKRNTWQPNEITSIIRSSQEFSKDVSPTSSFEENVEKSRETTRDQAENFDSTEEEDRSSQATIPTDSIEPSTQDTLTLSHTTISVVEKARVYSHTLSMDPGSSVAPVEIFTPRKLKRTSSMVRIAMSLDGEATVIRRGETPSPPNKIAAKNNRAELGRSKSLVSPVSLEVSTQDIPQALLPGVPRIPGRSRDSRNWEFWADSERREQLTKSAEINRRDSAAGPIALIRSQSSNKVESKKRKSEGVLEERQPKLGRTKSSNGRLQSGERKKKYVSPIYREGDSDKENVDPNDLVITSRSIATPRVLAGKRKILQENTTLPSHATSLGALLAKDAQANTPTKTTKKTAYRKGRRTVAADDQENVVVDSEVASFMMDATNKNECEDMDAVQNLLSLSQGAWKS